MSNYILSSEISLWAAHQKDICKSKGNIPPATNRSERKEEKKMEGHKKKETTSTHVETTLDVFIVHVALNGLFGACAIRRWWP